MDELKKLHEYLRTHRGHTSTYDTFVADMRDAGKRERLYSALRSDGVTDEDATTFEQTYFGGLLEKKNDNGGTASGLGSPPFSSYQPAPAPIAGERTASDAGNPLADLVSPQTRDSFYPEPNLGIDTNLTPEKILEAANKKWNYTGDEDPVEAAKALRQQREVDFAYKEKYASLSESRQATRELENLGMLGKELINQRDFAERELSSQFGTDWLKTVDSARKTVEAFNANPNPTDDDERAALTAKQQFEAIAANPEFNRYAGAMNGLSKAEHEFGMVPLRFPEFEAKQRLAEIAQEGADRRKKEGGFVNEASLAGDWLLGKMVQYASATASIGARGLEMIRTPDAPGPRSPEMRASDWMQSWADDALEAKEVFLPRVSKYNRGVFEPTVEYKGQIVKVKPDGTVAKVYDKDGYPIEPKEGFAEDFVASGEGKKATDGAFGDFQGWGLVGDKTLDVLADLLAMRGAGGGAKIGTMVAGATMVQHDMYNEAIRDLGMSKGQASAYASVSSMLNGAIEAYVGGIETNLFKPSLAVARQLGLKEARAVVSNGGGLKAIVDAAWKPVLKQVGEENGEEILQAVQEDLTKRAWNASVGSDLETGMTKEEIAETLLLTTVATLPMAAMGAGGHANAFRRSSLMSAVNAPEKFEDAVGMLVENGAMTLEDATAQTQRIRLLAKQSDFLPETLNDDSRATVVSYQDERNAWQGVVESEAPEAQRKIARAQIQKLDTIIGSIVAPHMRDSAPPPSDPEASGQGEVVNAPEDVAPAPIEMPQEPEAFEVPSDPESIPAFEPQESETTPDFDPFSGLAPHIATAPDEMDAVVFPTARKGDGAMRAATTSNFFNNPSATVADAATLSESPGELADDLTNAATQHLRNRGYGVEPAEIPAIRAFFAPHFLDPNMPESVRGEQPARLLDDLATEWMGERGKKNKTRTSRQKTNIETTRDAVADFFAAGGKVTPSSYYRNGDRNFVRDGSLSALYLSGDGRAMDDLAQEIAGQYEMTDEADVLAEISDFMHTYPSKNTSEYFDMRAEQQSAAAQDAGYASAFDASVPEFEATAEEKAKEGRFVEESVSASEFSEDELVTAEAFVAKFDSVEAFMQAMEDDFNPDVLELPEGVFKKVKSAYESVKNGKTKSNATQSGSQADVRQAADQTPKGNEVVESAQSANGEAQSALGQSETRFVNEAVEKAEDAMLFDMGFAEAEAMLDKALANMMLPEEPTDEMIAEMAAFGIVSEETAVAAMRGDESAKSAVAEKVEQLRTVDVAAELRMQEVAAQWPADASLSPFSIEETDGTMVVLTVGPHWSDILAKHAVPTQRGTVTAWEVKRGNESRVRIEMGERYASVSPAEMQAMRNAPGSPTATGRFLSVLRKPLALLRHRQTERAVAQAGTLADRIMAAQRSLRLPTDRRAAKVARAVRALEHTFPGIQIVTDGAAFDSALVESGRPELVGVGRPAGMQFKGVVYLDMEQVGAETPMHEFGHIWMNWLKMTDDPDRVYARGVELVTGSVYENRVRADGRYSDLTDEEIADEALAIAIGERGAALFDDEASGGFQRWLADFWAFVQRRLGVRTDNATISEWADSVALRMVGDPMPDVRTEMLEKANERAQMLFGGQGANIYKDDLAAAKRGLEKGADPRAIWAGTGWYLGVDGKWRFEIPDNRYFMYPLDEHMPSEEIRMSTIELPTANTVSLDSIIEHPELNLVYPEVMKTPVTFGLDPKSNVAAAVRSHKGEVYIVVNMAKNIPKDVLLHEIQHAIQVREGMSPGFSPGFTILVEDALVAEAKEVGIDTQKIDRSQPYGAISMYLYRNSSGETEARLTQARMALPEFHRRGNFPEDGMDVAPEEQHVFWTSGMKDGKSGFEIFAGQPLSKPQFQYELRRMTDVAVLTSARMIARAEIGQTGMRNIAEMTRLLQKELGLDRSTAEAVVAEAVTSVSGGGRIVLHGGRSVLPEKQWSQKVRGGWAKWLRPGGAASALPKTMREADYKRQHMIAAHMYRANVLQLRLRAEMSRFYNDDISEVAKQQVHAVLVGEANWAALPAEYAGTVQEIRELTDRMTVQVLQAGAVSKKMALTFLENAGFDVAVDGIAEVTTAMAKLPSQRTGEEVQAINNFLETNSKKWGAYMNRSYLIHATKGAEWSRQVDENVWNAARDWFLRDMEQKVADLESLQNETQAELRKRVADLDAEVATLAKSQKTAEDEILGQMKAVLDNLESVSQAELDKLDADVIELGERNRRYIGKYGKKSDHILRVLYNKMKRQREITDLLEQARRIGEIPRARATGMLEREDLQMMQDIHADPNRFPALIRKLAAIAEAAGEANKRTIGAINAKMTSVENAEEILSEPDFNRLPVVQQQILRRLVKIKALEARKEQKETFKQGDIDILNEQMANIDGWMNSYLYQDDVSFGGAGGTLGTKNQNILKHRKDLPPEIRDLLGEIRDPFVTTLRTVAKMSELLESQRFLTQVREHMGGTVVFAPDDIGSRGANLVQIAAPSNSRLAPLNGWYTTSETYDAMRAYYEVTPQSPIWSWVLGHIVFPVKYGKTILSPVTHVRNFVGNFMFVLENGWIDPRNIKDALLAFRNADAPGGVMQTAFMIGVGAALAAGGFAFWPGTLLTLFATGNFRYFMDETEMGRKFKDGLTGAPLLRAAFRPLTQGEQEYVAHLTELGIFGESVSAGSIREMLDTAPKELKMFKSDHVVKPDGTGASVAAWQTSTIQRFFSKTATDMERLYQAEDVFFRVLGFETEKKRYAKALFGKQFDELSLSEQAEVEVRAAGIISGIMPTYSRVPRVVSALRNFGLTGTFIHFPAEMMRVMPNHFRLMYEELKDPKRRVSGTIRLLGTTAFHIGLLGVGMAMKSLLGMGDDEDDAARSLMPNYRADNVLLYTARNGNEISSIDMSYIDPSAMWKEPLVSLMTKDGRAFSDKMQSAAYRLIDPYLREDLALGTLLAVHHNYDWEYNRRIYNPSASEGTQSDQIKDFVLPRLGPGFFKSFADAKKAMDGEVDTHGNIKKIEAVMLAHTTGLVENTFDIRYAFNSKAYQMASERKNVRAIYKDVQKKIERKAAAINRFKGDPAKIPEMLSALESSSAMQLLAAEDAANWAYVDMLTRQKENIRKLRTLGLSDGDLGGTLKGNADYNASEVKYLLDTSGQVSLPKLVFNK